MFKKFGMSLTIVLFISLTHCLQGQVNQDLDQLLPFKAYKSNYIIYDFDDSEIKIQLSIKFQFITSPTLAGPLSFLKNFYFGYSQKSFWDIGKPSAPFSDHNFNPELFYTSESNFPGLKSYRIGFLEHESNGEDEERSRSWDRVYIRPVFGLTDKITLAPKLWIIINKDENNSDIADFFGYSELSLRYLSKQQLKIEFTGRVGEELRKGYFQADISFPWNLLKEKTKRFISLPPFTSPLRFNPHWLIQGWHGYGENLLNYNKRESVIRLGILFTI